MVLKVDNGQGVKEKTGDGGQLMANTQFYVHYQGWAKKWDEWAKEDVVQAKKEKKLTKKKQTSSGLKEQNQTEKMSGKQINIQMPFLLKKQLVEDWKNVTHAPYKFVPLPRKPNVNQIIKTYLEFKKSKVRNGEVSDEKEYKNIEVSGAPPKGDRGRATLADLWRRTSHPSICAITSFIGKLQHFSSRVTSDSGSS
ncbi:unnamed protein product [Peronospora belbahrii]|uniref:MRG domain-containing protein n=1 Tax=Peronospora belbahrii TaxID=622444 RepID=A0ABN8D7M1_9STRA|nr:unnamed protein product [Peronospora belbahrii]